ncbi:RNA polymerase subunit sigma-70 [Brachybacterium tyrofermentans]|uniref:RNA polymerase subunit sigma-70 n=1 Tax=Brachybacterium tyrofermentans TaxID=47848 RepID=UPI000A1ABDB2|nr:RNA polymerase subunit sigma-70 [Brachybacterium tyrofermentans]SLM96557.1 RNA polymerase sigma factor [Corynebacterium xerosis]
MNSGQGRQEAADAKYGALFDAHRRELIAHCYRMTGSFTDAEELAQETFLRAWRARAQFEERSSGRTWLYRIATNACLDFLKSHERRTGPHASVTEILENEGRISPHPEHDDPAELVSRRESTTLEVMAALLDLPARQRAVLIARDLLEFSTAETAALLDCSTASVNSLLQRARTRTRRIGADFSGHPDGVEDSATAQIVRAYLEAHENGDINSLVELFTTDARLTMPPEAACVGRLEIREFFTYLLDPANIGYWRLVETRANGAPAIANYIAQSPGGPFTALSIDVLQVDDGRISAIHSFLDASHFQTLGLPHTA